MRFSKIKFMKWCKPENLESIWGSKIETIEKDEKVRRLYNKYRSKDMLLEQIEARLKSCINDIDFYENKYKK